jgi:RNA polymerase sigma-70 factor (ECF subfamily)
LIRLRNARDDEAWRQFVDVYGPAIYRFARKRGLQDADATDLTQIVLQAVSSSIRRFDYDPERGSFRGWLFGVVRNQIHKLADRRRAIVQASGDSAMQQVLEHQPWHETDPQQSDETLWDIEYQRQLFIRGADRARPYFAEATWQAFWLTTVEDTAAGEVAERLGMSVGAVYTAKSRVLDRIRQEIQQLQME